MTAILGVAGLAVAVAVGIGIIFERRMGREIEALLADARPPGRKVITNDDLERLPDAVQRWLRYSKVVGRHVPATVRLRQDGQFQMQEGKWMPFEAEQYFTINPPGFLWKATFQMAPLVSVTGRDQYRAGEASMEMRTSDGASPQSTSTVPVGSSVDGTDGQLQWSISSGC